MATALARWQLEAFRLTRTVLLLDAMAAARADATALADLDEGAGR